MIPVASASYIGYLDIIPEEIFYEDFYSGNAVLAGIQAGLDYLDSFHKTLPESMFLDDYLDAGIAYIDLKKYDAAEDMFSLALGIEKDNVDALLGLGMIKFFKGQYPFASSKFDDVLRKDPRNTLAYTYKAVSQANSGNLDQAIESIEKSISYGGKEAIAWYYAAAIYAENGDMNKAVNAIETAKSLELDNQYIIELANELAGSPIIPPTQVLVIDDFSPQATIDTKLQVSEEINSEYWEGFWDTNFGVLEIEEITDRKVTGTYTHDSGKITGSIKGNILSGTWSEEPSYLPPKDAGDFEFTLKSDGLSFIGKYRYGSSGTWKTWDGEKLTGEDALKLGNNDLMDKTPTYKDTTTSLDSLNFDQLLSTGQSYLNEKEYASAEEYFEKAVTIDETSENAWKGYLSAIWNQDKYDKQLEKAKEVQVILPDLAEAYFYAGNALYHKEKYLGALDELEKAITISPMYQAALNTKGLIYLDQDQHNEAIEIFDRIIDIDPSYKYAWYNKGRAHRLLEEYDEAIEAFDEAIKLDPHYEYAWYFKGLTLDDLKKYHEAVKAFDEAITIDPNYKQAWVFKGNSLYDLEEFDEALASYKKAVTIDPEYAYAWQKQGDTYLLKLKKYKEALQAYEKVLELDINDDYVWSGKGVALFALGRNLEALQAHEKAISLDPDEELYWFQKGMALQELGRIDEAFEAFDKAIALGDTKHAPAAKSRLQEKIGNTGTL